VPIKGNDFAALGAFALENGISMVVVGPEEPLVKGIRDYFLNDPALKSIPVIGPSREGARLEGSKDYAKAFMMRHNIPTARYQSFTKDTLEAACAFLKTLQAPYVLKADGLAAGKGVLIVPTLEEAQAELAEMFSGKFGAAGNTVVIEEFLDGIELSVFALTDGTNYLILPEAKDYKRVGEGNTGLNTGGMGAVSPVPFADKAFMQKVEDRIVRPTIQGLKSEGIDYIGFVFFGLINVQGEPMVIEYNVRMGDPETEAVMPRLQNDLVELLQATARGILNQHTIRTDPRFATTIMLVSGGYPGDYEKGKVITGCEQVKDALVFHAGSALSGDSGPVVTAGGRVIAITAYGDSMNDALRCANQNAPLICFEGRYYRTDIGFDLK